MGHSDVCACVNSNLVQNRPPCFKDVVFTCSVSFADQSSSSMTGPLFRSVSSGISAEEEGSSTMGSLSSHCSRREKARVKNTEGYKKLAHVLIKLLSPKRCYFHKPLVSFEGFSRAQLIISEEKDDQQHLLYSLTDYKLDQPSQMERPCLEIIKASIKAPCS